MVQSCTFFSFDAVRNGAGHGYSYPIGHLLYFQLINVYKKLTADLKQDLYTLQSVSYVKTYGTVLYFLSSTTRQPVAMSFTVKSMQFLTT